MNAVLAIDPGSTASGWATLDLETQRPLDFGRNPNPELLADVRKISGIVITAVVVEWMTSYGRTVGAETFEALWWAGRFAEAADARGLTVSRIARSDVVRHLLGGPRRPGDPSADAMVWQVIVDRYGGVGGRSAAVGTKAAPGPLHGIHADARAALAVGLTWLDRPELRR